MLLIGGKRKIYMLGGSFDIGNVVIYDYVVLDSIDICVNYWFGCCWKDS